jgi:hypothetical protein
MRTLRSFLPATRGRRILLGAVVTLLLIVYAVSFLADEPIRRRLEAQMNANLVGYAAKIRAVRFHPFGFSITLKDTQIVQDKHPKPPVADFPRLDASVQWRALLSFRLVADFKFDRPKIHVDRTHVEAEAKDKTPVDERGWQEALESIYPLKINEFVINDGEITYIENKKSKPLKLDRIDFRANNIRNIRSRERTYPSDVQATGRIFETGTFAFDGNADFMAEPYAGLKGEFQIDDAPLDPFKPVAERYNLIVSKGKLSLVSDIEMSPKVKTADVRQVTLRDLDAAYVSRVANAGEAEKLREKTADAAAEVSNDPGVLLVVRKFQADRGRVRFINELANPDYTLTLDQAKLVVNNLSNHAKRPPTTGELSGRFMGSGATKASFTFRPETSGPNFDIAIQIQDTDMVAMNDLFRAYGNFDVASGKFGLTTELDIQDQRIEGYLKPFFVDMKVYDRKQDAGEGVMHQIYEGLVGGVARLLENPPRDAVATKATITGPVDNPKIGTLQLVLRLIQNAFFRAILPGFEAEARANA